MNAKFYPWASRHPWQSWRTRYKDNQGDFDEYINGYLERHPPHPQGKGEYMYKSNAREYARRAGQGRFRVLNERAADEEHDNVRGMDDAEQGNEEANEEGDQMEEVRLHPTKKRRIAEEDRNPVEGQDDRHQVNDGLIDFNLYVLCTACVRSLMVLLALIKTMKLSFKTLNRMSDISHRP